MSLVIWFGFVVAFLAGLTIGVALGKRVERWVQEDFNTTSGGAE